MILQTDLRYSLLVRWLPSLRRYARGPLLRRIYWALYRAWQTEGRPVRTTLHGYSVFINRGNIYPFIASDTPLFNAPLVQLVHEAFRANKKPVEVLDVGAAVGDTILLLK